MTTFHRPMLVLVAALAGCSTLKVNTQFDPSAPYGSYKTYAWLSTTPGVEQAAAIRNPAARGLVITAVDHEMARRGLSRVTPDQSPDFFVSVIGWGQSRVDVTTYGYAYMGAYAYGPWGPTPVAVPVTEVTQYTDGTLVIDFVDARSKKLFWRGTAADTVTSPAQLKGTIDDATKKLLDAYPPRPQ